jgi:hypothetical protein
MPTLNASCPRFNALIRREFLYNLEHGHGEYEPALVFGVASITGRALLFHCLLTNGAQIGRLPLSAFCWKECEPLPIEVIQTWDSFSYDLSVTEYEALKHLHCAALLRDKTWRRGVYMFTVDWYGSALAEDAGDNGWKCAHVIKLDTGHFAAVPNNRSCFLDAAHCTKPFVVTGERPDYKTMTHMFHAEDGSKWVVEDSNRFYYADVDVQSGPGEGSEAQAGAVAAAGD